MYKMKHLTMTVGDTAVRVARTLHSGQWTLCVHQGSYQA